MKKQMSHFLLGSVGNADASRQGSPAPRGVPARLPLCLPGQASNLANTPLECSAPKARKGDRSSSAVRSPTAVSPSPSPRAGSQPPCMPAGQHPRRLSPPVPVPVPWGPSSPDAMGATTQPSPPQRSPPGHLVLSPTDMPSDLLSCVVHLGLFLAVPPSHFLVLTSAAPEKRTRPHSLSPWPSWLSPPCGRPPNPPFRSVRVGLALRHQKNRRPSSQVCSCHPTSG